MNNNFLAYARDLIANMSLDELERRLNDFGFEVERKVTLWDSDDLMVKLSAPVLGPAPNFNPASFDISGLVPDNAWLLEAGEPANDNSYALAA